VDADGNATSIAKQVSLDSRLVSPEHDPNLTGVSDPNFYKLAAFVSKVDGELGELGLMTRATPTTLRALSSQVRVGNFEFFQNMAAIGYLDQFNEDTKTGRLVVNQTTLDAQSIVSKNVVEFTELIWPWEGVLYTVKEGDAYSLWAARAK
jgi:hypothetical protein